MMSRASLVYALLASLWCAVIGWQVVEHVRVKRVARTLLINRASDIATTLGLVIRSQRRWAGVVQQERLESALNELVKSGELASVALLNAAGDVVASAGPSIPFEYKDSLHKSDVEQMVNGERVRWGKDNVTVIRLIDLGASVTPSGQTNSNRPTIVFPRRDSSGNGPEERFPGPFGGRRFGAESSTNNPGTNSAPTSGSRGDGRPGRPPWMTESEFKSLVEKQGLHGFAMVMSSRIFNETCSQDLLSRWIIVGFGTISAFGFGLAWRNLSWSSDLQMRLVKASDLNTHLKEMNIAAAGLAHETRNPLNIIRGLAQMISRDPATSAEIRAKSRDIIDETDRVTGQLTEFINYSKPREVRLSPVMLNAVIGDIARALKCDLEDKSIQLTVTEEKLTVEADEKMLRQLVFNLLINAIQAVDPQGTIEIAVRKSDSGDASLEVRDNGPGVPVEQQKEIFKPYFTTNQKGTGLGLAVVQQIVLAHGWEIECLTNEPKGALFRLSHLKVLVRA